jgi:hypothetical protein
MLILQKLVSLVPGSSKLNLSDQIILMTVSLTSSTSYQNREINPFVLYNIKIALSTQDHRLKQTW